MQVEVLTAELGLTGLVQFLAGLKQVDDQLRTTRDLLLELKGLSLDALGASDATIAKNKANLALLKEERDVLAQIKALGGIGGAGGGGSVSPAFNLNGNRYGIIGALMGEQAARNLSTILNQQAQRDATATGLEGAFVGSQQAANVNKAVAAVVAQEARRPGAFVGGYEGGPRGGPYIPPPAAGAGGLPPGYVSTADQNRLASLAAAAAVARESGPTGAYTPFAIRQAGRTNDAMLAAAAAAGGAGQGGGGGGPGFFGGLLAGAGFGGGGIGVPWWLGGRFVGGRIGGGLATFGSLAGLAGFGAEHLATSAIGIGGSILGAGAGGLLAGAGIAGTAGVGIGTDLAGIGQAAGDIKNVSQGLTALQTAIAVYGRNSQQAADAQAQLNNTLGSFSQIARPAVVAAAQTAQAFHQMFNAATGEAEKIGAEIINQAMQTGEAFLPTIGKFAGQNLGIIQRDIQPLFAWLKNPGGQGGLGVFTQLEKIFQAGLPAGVNALTQGIELFVKTIGVAASHTQGFIQTISRLLTEANSPSGFAKWSVEIGKLIDLFHTWIDLGGAIARTIFDIFKPAAGFGAAFATALTNVFDQIDNWLKQPSIQELLHGLFVAHLTQVIQGLGGIFSALLPVLEAATADFIKLSIVMTNLANDVLVPVANILKLIFRIPFVADITGWVLAVILVRNALLALWGVTRAGLVVMGLMDAAIVTTGTESAAAAGSVLSLRGALAALGSPAVLAAIAAPVAAVTALGYALGSLYNGSSLNNITNQITGNTMTPQQAIQLAQSGKGDPFAVAAAKAYVAHMTPAQRLAANTAGAIYGPPAPGARPSTSGATNSTSAASGGGSGYYPLPAYLDVGIQNAIASGNQSQINTAYAAARSYYKLMQGLPNLSLADKAALLTAMNQYSTPPSSSTTLTTATPSNNASTYKPTNYKAPPPIWQLPASNAGAIARATLAAALGRPGATAAEIAAIKTAIAVSARAASGFPMNSQDQLAAISEETSLSQELQGLTGQGPAARTITGVGLLSSGLQGRLAAATTATNGVSATSPTTGSIRALNGLFVQLSAAVLQLTANMKDYSGAQKTAARDELASLQKARTQARQELDSSKNNLSAERILGIAGGGSQTGGQAARSMGATLRDFLNTTLKQFGLGGTGSAAEGPFVKELYKAGDINKRQYESLEKILATIREVKKNTGDVASGISGNVSQRLAEIKQELQGGQGFSDLNAVSSEQAILRRSGVHVTGTARERARLLELGNEYNQRRGTIYTGLGSANGVPLTRGGAPALVHHTIDVHVTSKGQAAKEIADAVYKIFQSNYKRNSVATTGSNAGRNLGMGLG